MGLLERFKHKFWKWALYDEEPVWVHFLIYTLCALLIYADLSDILHLP